VAGPSSDAAPGAVAPAAERDRVLDGVRASALGVVVLGHALAWDVSTGTPVSIADTRPDLVWLTWVVQVLPLFFAVGAVVNLGSLRRRPRFGSYARRRLVRLGVPSLVYATFWTALLLPLAPFVPLAEVAGDYLATLTWFLGVYAAAVLATPWTSTWAARAPALTIGAWFAAIVAVDVVRFTVAPLVGWLNVVLVWCWLHQLGFHLPALRRRPAGHLLALAAATFAAAALLAGPGPYASALVTFDLTDDRSNFTPPTAVLALFGAAQVLVLAAVYPWLTRLLARERVWGVVGPASARAIGLYLWHIPWVGAVAVVAWETGFAAAPLSWPWWLAHAAGLAVVIPLTWLTAGLAAEGDRAVITWLAGRRRRRLPAAPFALLAPVALLLVTITGYGTWGGTVFLGIVPSSSLLSLALLATAVWGLAVSDASRVASGMPGGAGGPRSPAD
jgi:peptidoglycan/LPS O-acetylase OafA/YrhL